MDDHNELQAPEWTKGLQKQTPLALRIQVDRMVARWVDSYSGLGSLRWLLQWLMPPIGLLAGAWRAWSRTATVKSRLASGHKPQPSKQQVVDPNSTNTRRENPPRKHRHVHICGDSSILAKTNMRQGDILQGDVSGCRF